MIERKGYNCVFILLVMELDDLRGRIDVLDEGIIELLAERAKVVCEIKGYKDSNGLGILDEDRENNVFEGVRNLARENGLDEDFIERVFREVVAESKKMQCSLKDEDVSGDELILS
ncbi:MAG: chorismate mutase [Candidatus Jacksonbacteria bacterium]|nr:chorismate mutase [Candidatus Jacksonbacteria bacterium]